MESSRYGGPFIEIDTNPALFPTNFPVDFHKKHAEPWNQLRGGSWYGSIWWQWTRKLVNLPFITSRFNHHNPQQYHLHMDFWGGLRARHPIFLMEEWWFSNPAKQLKVLVSRTARWFFGGLSEPSTILVDGSEILQHLWNYETLWKIGYSPYQLVAMVLYQLHIRLPDGHLSISGRYSTCFLRPPKEKWNDKWIWTVQSRPETMKNYGNHMRITLRCSYRNHFWATQTDLVRDVLWKNRFLSGSDPPPRIKLIIHISSRLKVGHGSAAYQLLETWILHCTECHYPSSCHIRFPSVLYAKAKTQFRCNCFSPLNHPIQPNLNQLLSKRPPSEISLKAKNLSESQPFAQPLPFSGGEVCVFHCCDTPAPEQVPKFPLRSLETSLLANLCNSTTNHFQATVRRNASYLKTSNLSFTSPNRTFPSSNSSLSGSVMEIPEIPDRSPGCWKKNWKKNYAKD